MTLKDFIGNCDRFAAKAGIEVVSVSQGVACARLVVTAEHLNAGGVCQGGAIFTLADTALALAANSGLKLTFTLDAVIYYHKSAVVGDVLAAQASTVCAHSRIPSFEVKVCNQRGELVASFKSTCYTKNVPLEGVETLE